MYIYMYQGDDLDDIENPDDRLLAPEHAEATKKDPFDDDNS